MSAVLDSEKGKFADANPFGIRRSVPISEGAAFLEISVSTTKALIREGKLRSIKIRGSRRLLVDSLLEVAERGTE